MHHSALKTLPFVLFALAMLALAGCNGTTVALGAASAGIIETKPATPPPADLSLQIPQHESWCYETMGYAECYAQPQNVDPNRLVNVDPPSRYPLTVYNYNEELASVTATASSNTAVTVSPSTTATTSPAKILK